VRLRAARFPRGRACREGGEKFAALLEGEQGELTRIIAPKPESRAGKRQRK
jgi:hypothetical protein